MAVVFAVLVAGAVRSAEAQSLAALTVDERPARSAMGGAAWSPVIFEVQTALAELGFYKGSIDGQYSIATGLAIRRYRQMHKLKSSEADWAGLLDHLKSQAAEARVVRSSLERARVAQIAAAREALDEQVELQLILNDRPGDASSDVESFDCLVLRTADCLFASASQAVDGIEREEYRNWALRDLIREQAMAGRTDTALGMIGRLSDPRLIFVALREISGAMARTGRLDEAVQTARLIPEARHRAKALEAIAKAMLAEKKYLGARRVGDEARQHLAHRSDLAERVIALAGLAETFAVGGDGAFGATLLDQAEETLAAVTNDPARDAAWAAVARVGLALGDRARAMAALRRIEDSDHQFLVMDTGMAATAGNGKPGRALRFARSIEELRYRILALCDVAKSRHDIGNTDGAKALLSEASRLVDEIDSPYARSFARARIAESRLGIGDFEQASETAARIDDDDLRARVLWTISERLRDAGRTDAARDTEDRALAEAGRAKSVFDRTTLLSGFAIDLARAGQADRARSAFEEAMAATQAIKIDWWRVRSLARAARALHELETRGVF